MARIVFIGAGSIEFTKSFVRDVLTFPVLAENLEVVLLDIDKERLNCSKKAVEMLFAKGEHFTAKVEATLDRSKALKGADAVIITILSHSTKAWRHDIEIPYKYGIDFTVGDTRGVAGIFRALRAIPVMLDICGDIERICPEAMVLNYTNPMPMLCRAMQKMTNLNFVGLCHSVQGTAEMLARWIGAPMDEITYVCAGTNHMAWYLEFKKNGKDAYPLIREAVKRKKIYNEEKVRNELFKSFGYYVTESSAHHSEYNWWFRKRRDLLEKYDLLGPGLGMHGYTLSVYLDRDRNWSGDVKKKLATTEGMSLERGHEYAAYILNAYMGGEAFEFNGNVPNTGLITNLPQDACVEVPVLVNKRGITPMYVGPLPLQLAAMNNLCIAYEEMAVEAALTGNPEMVYHAVCYDPLTATSLGLIEIRQMVKKMLRKSMPWLPQFKNIEF